MTIRYLFHSGFAIESDHCTVVIDYFRDDCEGERSISHGVVTEEYLKRPGAFYVLSSHGHGDHFNPIVLQWQKIRPDIQYILSRDILLSGKAKAAQNVHPLQSGERYVDSLISISAFGSTDLGISFVLSLDQKVLFHAGDLNNWHWNREASPEFAADAERAYLLEVSRIKEKVQRLDVAMFPVDPRLGPDCGRGAEQLMAAIDVRTLIPMHFSTDNSEPLRFLKAHPEHVVALTKRGETFVV